MRPENKQKLYKVLLAATVVISLGASAFSPAKAASAECSELTPTSSRPDMSLGDRGSCVSVVQQYLDVNNMYNYASYTGYFGPVTKAGVIKMQAKANLPETGLVDTATWRALERGGSTASSGLAPACITAGKVICIKKATTGSPATVYQVEAGNIVKSLTARTGDARGADYITNLGVYRVEWKDIDHVSHEYAGAEMPYSLFFNGGEAIHYSQLFHDGVGVASHGCVNLKYEASASGLYDWAPAGTRVVVAR